MSTKIYEGNRFPKTKLTDFVNTVRPAQYKLILEQARNLAARVPPEKLERDTWNCRVMWLTDKMREAADSSQRWPPWDLECGWRVWLPPTGRFAYATPWGEPYTRDGLALPAYVEDYPYWDNTDEPEGMSMREWRRRGRNWECATEPGGQANCVQLVAFEAEGYLSASLYVDLQNAGMPSAVVRLAALVHR